jgi:rhamnose transport system substrate-binding protein
MAKSTQQTKRERNMKRFLMGAAALALVSTLPQHTRAADVALATPGKAVSMVLLPKFLGILPFDLAHQGAEEAAKELKNPTPLQYLGPTPQNSVAGQIEIVTNSATQGANVIMMANNAGDQIVPAAKAAQAKGSKTCSSHRSTLPISAKSWPT